MYDNKYVLCKNRDTWYIPSVQTKQTNTNIDDNRKNVFGTSNQPLTQILTL